MCVKIQKHKNKEWSGSKPVINVRTQKMYGAVLGHESKKLEGS